MKQKIEAIVKKICGTEGELHVVKNLLKDATTLEKMVIICSLVKFLVGSGRQKEVHERLLMLPRESISCAVEISRGFITKEARVSSLRRLEGVFFLGVN
ncbi:hypothetical protein CFP56_014591 [Quercus suber]|uniref:Uncharacterized protein n=1 Tax=Quercus suber TaxID=58331 RepID=A0AAW0M5L9_QUESU